ncbi:MAG TPA: lysylphosphatidylglycerol synthase transmembrane domain-containing protein [Herpetosiphonaceae bacterium]|nr:lysylphosphatidylglycerol synthase transmembrane domain-containing protein [Herpetosiphonaceae bacterium]
MARVTHLRSALALAPPWLRWGVKLVLSAVLLGFVLRTIEPGRFLGAMAAIDPVWFAGAVVLFFPGKLLDAYRWHVVLRRLAQPLPYWTIVRYSFVGQVSALVLPGQISGDVVRVMAVVRGREGKLAFAVSAVIDKLALLIATLVFVLTGIFGTAGIATLYPVYLMALALMLVVVPVFIALGRFRTWPSGWRIGRGALWELVGQSLQRLGMLPRLSVGSLCMILGLGVGVQALYVLGSYCIAHAMQITIGLLDWATINAIVALVQLVPITIGGLGVREGVLVVLLHRYGVSSAQTIAYSLTGFAASVVLTIASWLLSEALADRMTEVSRPPSA